MLRTLNWHELTAHIDLYFFVQIFVVMLAAGLLGFERKMRDKPSGVRTSILIALGSMIFVKYSILIITSGIPQVTNPDPTRVIGQVVTGIGFLGAGTIMNRDGLVIGLTSAATIWVQAAIGVLVALGYFVDAFLFSLIALFTLNTITHLEIHFRRHVKKHSEDKFLGP
jgi:putative Mg2+ transporter-C (MgtC) family protein